MKHILYLASGSSRRFRVNKLLYELDGKPLYQHGLDMLTALVAGRDDCTLTVVSRYAAVREGAKALGVREGTVLAAIGVGLCLKLLGKLLRKRVQAFLAPPPQKKAVA